MKQSLLNSKIILLLNDDHISSTNTMNHQINPSKENHINHAILFSFHYRETYYLLFTFSHILFCTVAGDN